VTGILNLTKSVEIRVTLSDLSQVGSNNKEISDCTGNALSSYSGRGDSLRDLQGTVSSIGSGRILKLRWNRKS